MKVNTATKRYWARTGPSPIFGFDWEDRKLLSGPDAEVLFDQVWKSCLEPAVNAGTVVPAGQAKTMIPDDKRRNFFDPAQEHREIRLAGQKLLVQVDTSSDELTQMWNLNPKGEKPAPVVGARRDDPVVGLLELARKMKVPEADLEVALGDAIAEGLRRR